LRGKAPFVGDLPFFRIGIDMQLVWIAQHNGSQNDFFRFASAALSTDLSLKRHFKKTCLAASARMSVALRIRDWYNNRHK